ncbi:MAG: thiamine-phosphate kinase, partial [Bacteroidota bacterium]
MNEEQKRTDINTLGEFGLIKQLIAPFTIKNASTVVGNGDDGAVIYSRDKQFVVSTDLLIEGIHFDLMYVPLRHLGYKAVIVNLSDIYAMNARPTQITVSIALSNRFSLEALEELYAGIRLACEKYEVDLIGGDTTSSQKGLVISVTAIGEVSPEKYVLRSTAREGDLLCVSGDLGAAYLGLQFLEREKKIFMENPNIKPDLENQAYLVGRQLKPEARRDIITYFEKNEIIPTSMIDISDGLSSEILHLCDQSGLGCNLYEEKIPISEEVRTAAYTFNLDPTMCALSGGEDYELLFTLAQTDYDKIVLNEQISVIGYMTDAEEGTHI